MDVETLMDEMLNLLIESDDCLVKNDINSALRKTHECIALIKKFKEPVNEQ